VSAADAADNRLQIVAAGTTSSTPDFFSSLLSYCLHLLIGCDCVKVDQGGRLSAMGSVMASVVVEGDPAPDPDLRLRPGFPSAEIDAFILQGPRETTHGHDIFQFP
jgi:hypothetical protein